MVEAARLFQRWIAEQRKDDRIEKQRTDHRMEEQKKKKKNDRCRLDDADGKWNE